MPTGALQAMNVTFVASDSTAAAGSTFELPVKVLYDGMLDEKSSLRSTAVALSSAKRSTLSEQLQPPKDTLVTVASVAVMLTALVQLTGSVDDGFRLMLDRMKAYCEKGAVRQPGAHAP